ncbi:MAG TPA: site-2 protease family protein [Vicinamibacterales bacterium]|nr:site-2 protease family protein [Vicinamibacterales bacterium]
MAGLDVTEILVLMAVLVGSLSVHEAAHAWVASLLGDPTAKRLGRLTLNPVAHVDLVGTLIFPLVAISTGLPLIGWAKPVPVDFRHLKDPRRDFAMVAAAGPLSNLVMAVVGAAVFSLLGGLEVARGGQMLPRVVLQFVVLNVLLAVFNMVPVPPLDGGNVLMGLLPASGAAVMDRIRPYGFLVLYALMLTGVLAAIMRPVQRLVLGVLL